MLKVVSPIFVFAVIIISLTSCVFGAGTHGSLKGYRYQISKDTLASAVMYVINNNSNIYRDTIGDKILADIGDGKQGTIIDNSYNDGQKYLSIKIKTNKGLCDFTFRYYGDEQYWDASETSEIFICWAYDEINEGGSEGNGGVDKKTLKYLTELFEKEVVNNIDRRLSLAHVETK